MKTIRKLPLFLITPNSMSKEDIRRAERKCGIVIVESKEPDAVRLCEPPIDADIDVQAQAALSLMRVLINNTDANTTYYYKHQLTAWFVQRLIAVEERPQLVKKVPRK